MDKLKTLFKGNTTSYYPIVISQYERDGYSAPDNVDQLHWAIIVVVKERQQQGPCWQVYDRHYRDGRVEWAMSAISQATMGNTNKCLGGVRIGFVKAEDLSQLQQVVVSNNPSVKFTGWNCRDWVMEVITMLKGHNWVTAEINSQAALYPAMRQAGLATKELRQKGEQRVQIVDLFTKDYQ
ncbi:hypothetical protein FISHEDRAFT_50938 [Fistulina hepatica ATCC 64428]|uniref:Uncharacterized protein n=1 Tax=Fistulina hepatica ATCC 64428 TaxID=1128425 RepID=A0A0D7A0T3_9AGAR|nr:hypothetical protein FISHEDRAFT_50938 [Fistulina hepatica ATCC 64428]